MLPSVCQAALKTCFRAGAALPTAELWLPAHRVCPRGNEKHIDLSSKIGWVRTVPSHVSPESLVRGTRRVESKPGFGSDFALILLCCDPASPQQHHWGQVHLILVPPGSPRVPKSQCCVCFAQVQAV